MFNICIITFLKKYFSDCFGFNKYLRLLWVNSSNDSVDAVVVTIPQSGYAK